jgi:DMSO/TMAO reductase YedYZ molybdopterin-dependent catalytic subunit
MSLILPEHLLSRRRLLQWSGISLAGLLLPGCGVSEFSERLGQTFDPLNQTIEELLLSREAVPEFPVSSIEPDKLLINSFNGTPEIDPVAFRLSIDGEVARPMRLSLTEIRQLKLTSMVIRHVCVEGWAAIVGWEGVRLQDLARLVRLGTRTRYVYFESADGYYETWDIASALHPQTLLAYRKNGQPLQAANGAPLRLASPIKLGYKQSKWVTRISFRKELPQMKGYWEERGYEWFAGL